MTATQCERTKQALAETRELLGNEMSYQPQFRNWQRIDFYRSHIAKLEKMIDDYNIDILDKVPFGC